MKKKRNILKLILVVSLFLLVASSSAYADCQSDCRVAIDSADRLIKDLKDEVNLQKQIIDKQQSSISTLTVQNEEKADALASALHNPIYMGLLGAVLGGAAVYLIKR